VARVQERGNRDIGKQGKNKAKGAEVRQSERGERSWRTRRGKYNGGCGREK